MARPQENLGDAFSCRLSKDHDVAARAARADTGSPLSHIVRSWVRERFELLEQVEYLRARLVKRSRKMDEKCGLLEAKAEEPAQ